MLTHIVYSVGAPSSNYSSMPSLVTVSSVLEQGDVAPDLEDSVDGNVVVVVDEEDAFSVSTLSSEEEGRLLVDIDESASASSSDSSDSPPPQPRGARLVVRLQAQDWETWSSNNK